VLAAIFSQGNLRIGVIVFSCFIVALVFLSETFFLLKFRVNDTRVINLLKVGSVLTPKKISSMITTKKPEDDEEDRK